MLRDSKPGHLEIEDFYSLYEPEELEQLRAELLAGEIHEPAAIGSPHGACVANLNRLLVFALGERWIVRVQDAIELPPDSVPQPDVAVVDWREDGYATRLPRSGDVRLVVEVADSSHRRDRVLKLPLYAAAGIDEYWIVDLATEEIEIYTEPSPTGYGRRERRRRGDRVLVRLRPEVELELYLEVGAILPWKAEASAADET